MRWLIRSLKMAIWTSDDPVSFSFRRFASMTPALVVVASRYTSYVSNARIALKRGSRGATAPNSLARVPLASRTLAHCQG